MTRAQSIGATRRSDVSIEGYRREFTGIKSDHALLSGVKWDFISILKNQKRSDGVMTEKLADDEKKWIIERSMSECGFLNKSLSLKSMLSFQMTHEPTYCLHCFLSLSAQQQGLQAGLADLSL
jgi:hypothetical protein